MKRWLVILCVVIVHDSALAATSKKSEFPIWKQFLSLFNPAPAHVRRHFHERTQPAEPELATGSVAKPEASRARQHAGWSTRTTDSATTAAEPAEPSGADVPSPPSIPVEMPMLVPSAASGNPAARSVDPFLPALRSQTDATPAPAVDEPPSTSDSPSLAAPEPQFVHPRHGGYSDCGNGQRVVSSYYWQGRHTASGEPFNPHGLTAAHRTLPFGTRVTVSNPRTGQSVTVTINDRGPFVRGVNLDLSLGAAQAIGMRGTGVVCML